MLAGVLDVVDRAADHDAVAVGALRREVDHHPAALLHDRPDQATLHPDHRVVVLVRNVNADLLDLHLATHDWESITERNGYGVTVTRFGLLSVVLTSRF